jgi:lipoic acid synthetase
MVGLGETEEEVIQTMKNLRSVGVDILTIGQYLQPTKRHLNVVEYVPPYKFKWYRDIGLQIGFKEVFSGPLVRSSYRAEKVFYGEV